MNLKGLAKKPIDRQLRQSVIQLLSKYHPTIVAITGSVGKTSAKNAIRAVLDNKYRISKDTDGYNTEIGLPLSFFGLKAPVRLTNPLAWQKLFRAMRQTIKAGYPYDLSVVEMGADHPGEIAYFLEFIKPNIGVVTGIGAVHTAGFGSVEAILAEKWLLAQQSDQVVYNADFELLRKKAGSLPKNKLVRAYGLDYGEITFKNIRRNSRGLLEAKLCLSEASLAVSTQMVSRTSLYSLLAAVSVGELLGVAPAEIGKILGQITPTTGRMRLLEGKNGSQILDDSYNASPLSTIAALETLAEFPAKKRIAILGNMNELGEYSAQGHQEVGTKAAAVVDLLVTIGDEAQQYLATAGLLAGLLPDQVKCFDNPKSAGEYVQRLLDKDSVVLVKGSQNKVFSEEAVRGLLHPSLDPSKHLVRQSQAWQKVKRAYR